ncbi:hypothetical protein HDZ31DRAFT_65213 [Schizophyllum fasciatum]
MTSLKALKEMNTERIENSGSTARDFLMLERNILSHLKLAILLALVSWSVLLHARLVPLGGTGDYSENTGYHDPRSIALGSVQFVAALITMVAGGLEFHKGFQDLRNTRPFLEAPKVHLMIMGIPAIVVLATCIALLVDDDLL